MVSLWWLHWWCDHCSNIDDGGDGIGIGEGEVMAWFHDYKYFLSHGGHLLVAAVKDTVLVSKNSSLMSITKFEITKSIINYSQ